MITSEKIKLLINDPKFRQLKDWSQGSREEALNKIYASQKQIHRAKVVQQCLVKKDTVGNVDTSIDFLQSKIKSIDNKIVNDIQRYFCAKLRTLWEKERVQEKYKELEDIYEKANTKYVTLLDTISADVNYEPNLEQVILKQIKIEKQVAEIKELYEQNMFLKNMNNQIKKRIREKQQKAKIVLTTP